MKCSLDATQLRPNQRARLKALMGLLAKAKAFREASVRVVHYYTQPEWEQTVSVELLACGTLSCVRGRGGTIQRGDHIVLQSGSHTIRYHVDEIDYEATPSAVWVALLRPCSERMIDSRLQMQPVRE